MKIFETKHTKGEWELHKTTVSNCLTLKSKSGEYITMLSLNVERPALMKQINIVNKANAKLIAASPILLEALIEAANALSSAINATPSGELRNKLADANILALTAIQKSV